MDPHFLRNIQKSHLAECQDYWGPKFVLNVQAITAYGEVILEVSSESEYDFAMVRRVYDGRTGAMPGGEESVRALVNRGAELFSETLNRSEEALDKLSSNTKQLADALGPIGKISNVIHETTHGSILDDIVFEQELISKLLSSAKQELETLKTLWVCMKSFLQRSAHTIGEKKYDIAASMKVLTSRCESSKQLCTEKSNALSDLNGHIHRHELTMKSNTPGFWGPNQQYTDAQAEINQLKPQVPDCEKELREVEATTEKMKNELAGLTKTASRLEMLTGPLNRAFATVDTTLSAYKSLLERLNEIDTKQDRFSSYLGRIKDPRNLNKEQVEYARVNAFQMAIEMRLTFNIIFEWSSLYVRVSRELLLPAFHEIYGGGSFDNVLKTYSESDMTQFRRRVQKGAGILPTNGLPLATRESTRLGNLAIAPSPSVDFFSGSLKNATVGLGYLKKISAFAELEVEKLYNNAQQDAVNRVMWSVEEVYRSTVKATPKQFKMAQVDLYKERFETLPNRKSQVRHQVYPVEEKIVVGDPSPPSPEVQVELPRRRRRLLGFR